MFEGITSIEKEQRGTEEEESVLGHYNPEKAVTHPLLEQRRKEILGEKEKDREPGLNFAKSLELTLITNPLEKQINPEQKVARDILDAVNKKSGIENQEQIRFFTAIGAPLDYHGIDGLVIINGIPVTVDVSRRIKEDEELKADILIPSIPLKGEGSSEYAIWVIDRARDIIEEYKEKLDKLNKSRLETREIANIRIIVDTLSKVLGIEDITSIEEVRKITGNKRISIKDRRSTRLHRAQQEGKKTTFRRIA